MHRVDVETGGLEPVRIAAEPDAELLGGVFSPDGTRILFRRPGNVRRPVHHAGRRHGCHPPYTTSDDERFPAWGTHPLDE